MIRFFDLFKRCKYKRIMIFYCTASAEDIQKEGKEFKWTRPVCPKCGSRVHGHGFVSRFFNAVAGCIFVRRWRCPSCGMVITCRPAEYWPRYHESISKIFESLIYRVTHRKWPPITGRQRGGHWIRKLLLNARVNQLLKDSVLETIIFYQNKNLAIN